MSFLWKAAFRNDTNDDDDDDSVKAYPLNEPDDAVASSPSAAVETTSRPRAIVHDVDTEKTATTTTTEPVSWKEAHYKTCLRKGSLAVTPMQVWQVYSSSCLLQLPSKAEALLWRNNNEEFIQQLASRTNTNKGEDFVTTASDGNDQVSWTTRLMGALWLSSPDDDDDDWKDVTNEGATTIEDQDCLVNVQLTEQLLEYLRKRVDQQTESQVVTDLEAWLGQSQQSDEEMNDLITRISSTQLTVCWKALARQGCAVSLKDNLLIVGHASDTELETLCTLHRLDQTLKKAQTEQTRLENEVTSYLQLALRQQKKGIRPIGALRTKKLFEKRLEEKQGIIHNLEAAKLSLTSAAQNASLLDALSAATKTLQQLKPDIEQVDEIMLDHQDALGDLQQVQDSLLASTVQDNDDEALLAELEALTLEPPEEEAVTTTTTTTAARTEKEDLPLPEIPTASSSTDETTAEVKETVPESLPEKSSVPSS